MSGGINRFGDLAALKLMQSRVSCDLGKSNWESICKETVQVVRNHFGIGNLTILKSDPSRVIGEGELYVDDVNTEIADRLEILADVIEHLDKPIEGIIMKQDPEIRDLKSQFRVLVMVIQNSLKRGNSCVASDKQLDSGKLNEQFQLIAKRFGVVPRLYSSKPEEIVKVPGYLKPDKLKNQLSDLSPSGLTPQVTTEMAERALGIGGSATVVRDPIHGASRIENTQRDHMQPKVDVFYRLKEMVLAMNVDTAFKDAMLAVSSDFFKVNPDNSISATKLLEEVFNKTIDNLWFMQSRGNTVKNDSPPVTWLLGMPGDRGKDFFRDMYIDIQSNMSGIDKEIAGTNFDAQFEFGNIEEFINSEVIDHRYVLLRIKGSEKTLLNAYTDWCEIKLGPDCARQLKIEKYSFRLKQLVGILADLTRSNDMSMSPEDSAELNKEIDSAIDALSSVSKWTYDQIKNVVGGEKLKPFGVSPYTSTDSDDDSMGSSVGGAFARVDSGVDHNLVQKRAHNTSSDAAESDPSDDLDSAEKVATAPSSQMDTSFSLIPAEIAKVELAKLLSMGLSKAVLKQMIDELP